MLQCVQKWIAPRTCSARCKFVIVDVNAAHLKVCVFYNWFCCLVGKCVTLRKQNFSC